MSTNLERHDVEMLLDRHAGARGIVQLRRAVELMDGGAESPQETRTRLLLMAAGFPRPQTQIVVCDEFGYFIGRVDMGWAEWKVGVEYDGPQHWATPADHARDHRADRRSGSSRLDHHPHQRATSCATGAVIFLARVRRCDADGRLAAPATRSEGLITHILARSRGISADLGDLESGRQAVCLERLHVKRHNVGDAVGGDR